ncbi:hypothetical protein L596_014006 [Steinernema carpocapsae]|uniref:Uncharacterized protein n=1 Tax=Steinernema carpocapsae TaxID=34508 RepID=A0A4U5NA47_STECR|nr:hypothetical protein L596_014006 [Steinernema carpocapsae]
MNEEFLKRDYYGDVEKFEGDDALLLCTPFEINAAKANVGFQTDTEAYMRPLKAVFTKEFLEDNGSTYHEKAQELLAKAQSLHEELVSAHSEASIKLVARLIRCFPPAKPSYKDPKPRPLIDRLLEFLRDGARMPQYYKQNEAGMFPSAPPFPHLQSAAKAKATAFLAVYEPLRKRQVVIAEALTELTELGQKLREVQAGWDGWKKDLIDRGVENLFDAMMPHRFDNKCPTDPHKYYEWKKERLERKRSRSRSPLPQDIVEQMSRIKLDPSDRAPPVPKEEPNAVRHFQVVPKPFDEYIKNKPPLHPLVLAGKEAIYKLFKAKHEVGQSFEDYAVKLIEEKLGEAEAESDDEEEIFAVIPSTVFDGRSIDEVDDEELGPAKRLKAAPEPADMEAYEPMVTLEDLPEEATEENPTATLLEELAEALEVEPIVAEEEMEELGEFVKHEPTSTEGASAGDLTPHVRIEDPVQQESIAHTPRHKFDHRRNQVEDAHGTRFCAIRLTDSSTIFQTKYDGNKSACGKAMQKELLSFLKIVCSAPPFSALTTARKSAGMGCLKITLPSTSKPIYTGLRNAEQAQEGMKFCGEHEKLRQTTSKWFNDNFSSRYTHQQVSRTYIFGDDIIARLNPKMFNYDNKDQDTPVPPPTAYVCKLCGPLKPFHEMLEMIENFKKIMNNEKERQCFVINKLVLVFNFEFSMWSQENDDFVDDYTKIVEMLKKFFLEGTYFDFRRLACDPENEVLSKHFPEIFQELMSYDPEQVALILVTVPEFGTYERAFRQLNNVIKEIAARNIAEGYNPRLRFHLLDWNDECIYQQAGTPGERYSALLNLLATLGITSVMPLEGSSKE